MKYIITLVTMGMKFLIVLLILSGGIGGFYFYTQSGKTLDEALPLTESLNKDRDEKTDLALEKQPLLTIMKGENLSEPMTKDEVQTLMETIEKMEETSVSESMPQAGGKIPVVSRKGIFVPIDFIHKGSGVAKIFPDTVEGHLLRLENFQVTNGPDLYVYVSKNTDIEKQGLGEYISLGALKGSKGNQNYLLPADYENYNTVVIWCQAFSVLFSYAVLQ